MNSKSNFMSRTLTAFIVIISFAVQFPALSIERSSAQANIDVDVTVSPSEYEGPCPGTIRFTARIKSDGPAQVAYTWLRSDGATAPTESIFFSAAGERVVSTTWTLGDAAVLPRFEGWQQLRVLAPADVLSNQARFTLKCGAGKSNNGSENQQPSKGATDREKVAELGSKIFGALGGKKRNNNQPPQTPDPQPQPPDCSHLPGGCRNTTPPPPSAQFRITVNGFRCDRRTNDKFLDEDGAKDEVFLRTEAALYDLSTHRGQPPHLSPTIGDSNTRPARIRAGRATSIGGGNGGFENGDGFPSSSTPWIRTGTPSDSRPPMLAWEGTLTQGADALALIPSIWEDDENIRIQGDSWIRALAGTWLDIDNDMRAAIRSRGGMNPSDGMLNRIARQFDVVRIPNAGNNDLDRPIGMEYRGGEYGYVPKVFVLTYDAADRASRDNSAGLGEGIIPVRFRDSGDLVGDYTIFLHVERISEASCAMDLGSMFNGSATMTTTNMWATGPFTAAIPLEVSLTNCRATLGITRFDPISPPPFPVPGGSNRATLSLAGGGVGPINTSNGRIDIPVLLRITNTNAAGGTSLIDVTLSTANPGGSRLTSGSATLTGSGVFRGGFLDGATGSFVVTGTFTPAP
jgi:hypothetical protein